MLFSCTFTTQLICAFGFTYAKTGFLMTWLNFCGDAARYQLMKREKILRDGIDMPFTFIKNTLYKFEIENNL